MRAAAESLERWVQGRPIGPLDGAPIALKENIDVAGLPCTAGTEAFRQRIPDRDAAAYRRLRGAGAVLLGKLNMHEGAFGGSTDKKAYGRCINPLKVGFTAGGSSGGSGAAVAAGLCVAALGTDTMGSIRVPASYCGIFGFKPTNGAISTEGVIPLSFTLDTVGPMARCAIDIVAVTEILIPWSTRPCSHTAIGWQGIRVGHPRQLQLIDLQPQSNCGVRSSSGDDRGKRCGEHNFRFPSLGAEQSTTGGASRIGSGGFSLLGAAIGRRAIR